MAAKKTLERVTLNPPVFLVAFSILGYFFLAAGGLGIYYVFLKNPIPSLNEFVEAAGFYAFALGFIALLLFIGWVSTKKTQSNMNELIEFEVNSRTTTAKTLKHGRKKNIDQYGAVYYTYWITVQFQPAQGRKEIILRVPVKEKRHDAFVAGEYFKVRYQVSDPRIALMEWETSRVERTPNFFEIMLRWILANIIGGVGGFYISKAIAAEDLILSGAIAGLIIALAQWAVLFRYFPVANWQWVIACVLGWAAFIRLNTLAYGLLGGTILGLVQWFVLRKKVAYPGAWIVFTAAGMTLAQIAFNLTIPGVTETAAGISFDVVYAVVSGIGIYYIASQSLTREITDSSPDYFQEPQTTEAEPKMFGILSEEMIDEMKLVVNGKAVSDAPDKNTIRQTLERLVEQEEGFVILHKKEMIYIQAAYIGGGEFIMEFQGGSTSEHYDCLNSDLDLEKVLKAFILFLNSDDRLTSEFSWELMAV